jgi:hypothetical protein
MTTAILILPTFALSAERKVNAIESITVRRNDTRGSDMKHKFKLWTGPCGVADIASKFRDAGTFVDLEGTENIYITIEGDDMYDAINETLKRLTKEYGSTLGYSARDFRRP